MQLSLKPLPGVIVAYTTSQTDAHANGLKLSPLRAMLQVVLFLIRKESMVITVYWRFSSRRHKPRPSCPTIVLPTRDAGVSKLVALKSSREGKTDFHSSCSAVCKW